MEKYALFIAGVNFAAMILACLRKESWWTAIYALAFAFCLYTGVGK